MQRTAHRAHGKPPELLATKFSLALSHGQVLVSQSCSYHNWFRLVFQKSSKNE